MSEKFLLKKNFGPNNDGSKKFGFKILVLKMILGQKKVLGLRKKLVLQKKGNVSKNVESK